MVFKSPMQFNLPDFPKRMTFGGILQEEGNCTIGSIGTVSTIGSIGSIGTMGSIGTIGSSGTLVSI